MKQSVRIKKWLIILAVISLSLVSILFVGGIILSTQYSSIIKKQLQEKLAPTVKVGFESCKINLLTRSTVFKNLQGSINTRENLSPKHHIF